MIVELKGRSWVHLQFLQLCLCSVALLCACSSVGFDSELWFWDINSITLFPVRFPETELLCVHLWWANPTSHVENLIFWLLMWTELLCWWGMLWLKMMLEPGVNPGTPEGAVNVIMSVCKGHIFLGVWNRAVPPQSASLEAAKQNVARICFPAALKTLRIHQALP